MDIKKLEKIVSEKMSRKCIARRWQKNGHDHIYFSYFTSSGNRKEVGCLDLDRNLVVPARKGRQEEALLAALKEAQ